VESTPGVGSVFGLDIPVQIVSGDDKLLDTVAVNRELKSVLIETEDGYLSFSSDIEDVSGDEAVDTNVSCSSDTSGFISSPRVLIAEDIQLNATLIKLIMKKILPGVQLLLASNGKEAVDLAMENDIDLVLMDVQMPVMDGLEATRELLRMMDMGELKRRFPIIALTAGVIDEDRDRCWEAGMTDFVPKPVEMENLKPVLEKYLGKK